ncbi:hypothetical protein SAMN04488128_1011787 [Chitinophaga eiseniae]|uniref:Uncharacterized protein n=1 Tax=Chitinophaga eiseniae TaxID=634771 RepID=A0A1T4NXP1_9BACT|nr:hypothetical protein [Chitinophaga eiseniae]SJZ83568.1 hypothetical protein SAMN04488128_1011787 [Chitinophaga eiseniae]
MLKDLVEEELKFQPFLLAGDYTFIGPEEGNAFTEFVKAVDRIAPAKGWFPSIHHSLANREAINKVLSMLPASIPLRIYVISARQSKDHLLHGTIEDYCRINNISLQ